MPKGVASKNAFLEMAMGVGDWGLPQKWAHSTPRFIDDVHRVHPFPMIAAAFCVYLKPNQVITSEPCDHERLLY